MKRIVCTFLMVMLCMLVIQAQDSLMSDAVKMTKPLSQFHDTRFILSFKPNKVFEQWGMICKSEWLMNKNSPIPLKFRLGDFEYTNRYERTFYREK